MKRGDIIGSFQLVDKIELFSHLSIELESMNSIFWRHRNYPTAFIRHWSYARLKIELKYGNFWYTKKIDK